MFLHELVNLQTKDNLGLYPTMEQVLWDMINRFYLADRVEDIRIVGKFGEDSTVYLYVDSKFDTLNYGYSLQGKRIS